MNFFSRLYAFFSDSASYHGSTGLSEMHQIEQIKPLINIDGTPMAGDVDILGRPFGVVDSVDQHHDSLGCSVDSVFDHSYDCIGNSSMDFSHGWTSSCSSVDSMTSFESSSSWDSSTGIGCGFD